MRLTTILVLAGLVSAGFAVDQASFSWQKELATPIGASGSWPKPVLLESGETVSAAATSSGAIHVSFVSPAGVVRVVTIAQEGTPLELGAIAADREGRVFVAAKSPNALKLFRIAKGGDIEWQKDASANVLVTGLAIERSGDLILSAPSFTGRATATGELAWRQSPPAPAAEIAVFQTGNAVVASNDPAGIRLAKFDPKGKELLNVLIPGGPATVVKMAIDAESNLVVLSRSAEGGLRLWSLDGASGLVRWLEDKLDSPDLQPVTLLTDPNKFILVGLNSTVENVTKAYVVRYSLGGQPLTNFQPTEGANRLTDMSIDVNGEVYVTCLSSANSRSTIMQYRLANNLTSRYLIKYSFPHTYEPRSTHVRDSDGAGYVYGLAGDPAGNRVPVVVKFNQAPVAKHETFTVPAGQPFVSPHSVLANDQYLEGAAMRLTQQPKEGQLEFRQDGTFTYTPKAGFTGKDTFRYQLSRGSLFWYAAIVTLDVK